MSDSFINFMFFIFLLSFFTLFFSIIKLIMKLFKNGTIFDVNYLNHRIKVSSKWDLIELIIDNRVCAQYKAIFASSFEINGCIKEEEKYIDVILELKRNIFSNKLYLIVDNKILAEKLNF